MAQKKEFAGKVAYGVGNLGYSITCQTMSNFIMFFASSVIKIPGTLVGIAIALSTFWDAITDPIVGHYCDQTVKKNINSRQNFIIISSLLLAILNLSIWTIPQGISTTGKFIWLLVSLLAFETADTFYSTPYNAIGIELAQNMQESTVIQSVKSFFYIIGMIMPSILMMIFMPNSDLELTQTSQTPYIKIGIITSFVCIICAVITFFSAKKKTTEPSISLMEPVKEPISKMFTTFFSMFKNKEFKNIIIGYCTSMMATCFLTSIGMHVFTYSFHYNSFQISSLLLTLCLGAMISQYFIPLQAKKYGKKQTLIKFMFYIIYSILGVLLLFLLKNFIDKSIIFYILILLIFGAGIGSGALYSLPFAIFADIVNNYNVSHKTIQTATFSGVMSFTFKVANALSLLIIGVLLDVINFNATMPVQSLSVQYKLGMILILGILASISISISLFSAHDDKLF